MYLTCTVKQAQAVKPRKTQMKRPMIPKGPIFSMNLFPSIWFWIKMRGRNVSSNPNPIQSTGSIQDAPTLKRPYVCSNSEVHVGWDKKARIGWKQPAGTREWNSKDNGSSFEISCRTEGLSPSKGNIAIRNKMLYECYPERAKANDPFTDSFQVV